MKDNKVKIKKVIQWVYNIISALFIIFVSGALIINANAGKESKNNDTPTSEVKSRDNMLVYDSAYVYALSTDVGNDSFMQGLNKLYKQETGNTFMEQSRYAGSFTWEITYPYAIGFFQRWYDINWENPASTTSADEELYGFRLTFSNKTTAIPTYKQGWYFKDMNCTLEFITTSSMQSYADASVISFKYSVVYDPSNAPYKDMFTRLKYNQTDSYFLVWSNRLYNDNRILPNIFETGEKENNIAYRQGYDKGYLDGSSGMDSNVFIVIGQAFGALGGLFGIELMPGLPLWILVFTPLIIAVVIVVIKLIKG